MEKQIDPIQETIDSISNDLNGHCCDLAGMFCGEVSCNICLTEYLFHAGYRRQDIIAREIIQVMNDMIEEPVSEHHKEYLDAIYHKGYMNAIKDWKQYIKKKYGVHEDEEKSTDD